MLYQLLGYEDFEFPAGLGWHLATLKSHPKAALDRLALAYGKPVDEVMAWCGISASQTEPLTVAQSDRLFRLALAFHRLHTLLGCSTITRNWLVGPRKELEGAIPALLLMSQPGAEAVFAVIARIQPARRVEPSVDSGNTETEPFEDD